MASIELKPAPVAAEKPSPLPLLVNGDKLIGCAAEAFAISRRAHGGYAG
jgi:hypothetical protein